MLKLVLLSIGLLLVVEGLLYFFLAGKLNYLLELLSNIDPQKIKTISLIMVVVGSSLIYITLRFYREY